jgi:hypothetical protein
MPKHAKRGSKMPWISLRSEVHSMGFSCCVADVLRYCVSDLKQLFPK